MIGDISKIYRKVPYYN